MLTLAEIHHVWPINSYFNGRNHWFFALYFSYGNQGFLDLRGQNRTPDPVRFYTQFNPMVSGRCGDNLQEVASELLASIDIGSISCDIALCRKPNAWFFNIGSSLVLSSNNPEPEPLLTQIYASIWCPGNSELCFINRFHRKYIINKIQDY